MIIWKNFQTSEDISRYKKYYLPYALRLRSLWNLDLYCGELDLSNALILYFHWNGSQMEPNYKQLESRMRVSIGKCSCFRSRNSPAHGTGAAQYQFNECHGESVPPLPERRMDE